MSCKVDNMNMTKQEKQITQHTQGGKEFLLGRNSDSEPPESLSIALANNRGFAIIDAEDYELISKHSWYALICKDTSYAYTKLWRNGKDISLAMHRLIMNCPTGQYIDHRDRNGLNNCKSNLRICSHRQNCMNQKPTIGTSKHKGVSWSKDRNRWLAKIDPDGKQKFLGRFVNEIDAAMAYNEAAKKYFGEFAYLNEIPEERLHSGIS